MCSFLEKLKLAFFKFLFSNVWFIVDFLVCFNIFVYCNNFNISVSYSNDYGIGIISIIIYVIYLIVCENLRLGFCLSQLQEHSS